MLDTPKNDDTAIKSIDILSIPLSDKEFTLFRELIYKKCSILLKESKKTLLTNRLGKRLRAVSCTSYMEYYNYLQTPKGNEEEFSNMVDCITTNKTEFFRNQKHFHLLTNLVLPELIAKKTAMRRRKLRVWSAGCSSGEEPYSLAITFMMLQQDLSNWDINIMASDISRRMLERAREGVYKFDDVNQLPQNILKQYFLKGPGKVKVKNHLKKMINFRYLNFSESFDSIQEPFDIIFCRNVIIYFDRETQSELMAKFYQVLNKGGFLFLGHSETLHSINDQFRFVSPSVYRK